MRDTDLCRDLGNGQRVITGDDLDLHTLFLEIFECLFGALTDTVFQRYEKHRQDVSVFLDFRKYQDTKSLLCTGFDLGAVRIIVLLGKKDIRRTEAVGLLLEDHLGILQFRGKGCHFTVREDIAFSEVIDQRIHGDVAVVHSRDIAGSQILDLFDILLFCILRKEFLGHAHLVRCDRTGLIYAEHIDTCQRLDRSHVVKEYFLLGQMHGTKGQGNCKQEIQSFRDHADDRTDHCHDRFADGQMVHGDTFDKECDTQWDDGDTGNLDDELDIVDHLGFLVLDLTCLGRQLGRIAVAADGGKSRFSLAGYNERSGHQLRSVDLFDLVGFTGQEGFIDIDRTLTEHTIGRDLLAALEMDDISFFELVHRDRHGLSASIDGIGSLCKHVQVIQYFL